MKKANFFSMQRFRAIHEEEYRICEQWFYNDSFYFFTKRPCSLIPGNIKNILASSCVFVDEKNKPVGIIKHDTEFFIDRYLILLEFRFNDNSHYENGISEKYFFGYIYYNFFELNKYLKRIMIRVYSFDSLTKDFLNKFDIKIEACLKKHVFKYNTFQDVLIYGIDREEYFKANNLIIN
ncbi:MAG: hypothetical protein JXB88_17345 [Spirochaetales bacterium]|nr:hypothetical protein [Spirochaetales bacterium]